MILRLCDLSRARLADSTSAPPLRCCGSCRCRCRRRSPARAARPRPASSCVCAISARAAASAYGPPEPIASTLSVGAITSPVPLRSSRLSRSRTTSIASSRRSTRSVRHSFASSVAAFGTDPWWSRSFASNRSSRLKASAAAPANPASTLPSYSLRIFLASFFITMLPSVTCPSPPMAAPAEVRTARIVVARRRGTAKIAPGGGEYLYVTAQATGRRRAVRSRPAAWS